MQALTDPPRDHLTEDQVRDLIVAGQTIWSTGAELLGDPDDRNISDNLISGTVTWDAAADDEEDTAGTVYRSCQIQLDTELAWGLDRVRLFVTADDLTAGISARFNLGVYVLSTPENTTTGETRQTWDVAGEDLLALFVNTIDDAIAFDEGTSPIENAKTVILSIDPTAVIAIAPSATVLPEPKSYVLSEDEQPTPLRIINDQLRLAAYQPVYVDQDGVYRSGPVIDPATRAPEWEFDVDDTSNSLVAPKRTLVENVWKAYNAWRFIASGLSFSPEEGDGMYTPPDNQSSGPTSIDAIGRRNQHTAFLDVADQAALVAQGDQIIAQDRRLQTSLTFSTYPFPIAGHEDIAQYSDGILGGMKLLARTWKFDLGGNGQPPADTEWTWSAT